MWMASKQGFKNSQKVLNKTPKELYKHIEKSQRENFKQGRVWYNKKIENLYTELMKE